MFLIALGAVAACLPTPSHAECDGYNTRFLKFNELKSQLAREMDRVQAMKPLPDADAALCHAAIPVGQWGNLLWRAPEPTCFQDKAQMDAFADKIRSMTEAAWDLAKTFCPDAEKPRP